MRSTNPICFHFIISEHIGRVLEAYDVATPNSTEIEVLFSTNRSLYTIFILIFYYSTAKHYLALLMKSKLL